MASKEFTNVYMSVRREDDEFLDNYRLELMNNSKKHYSKSETSAKILRYGIEVLQGKYLKLDPEIDKFVSQLQDMVIEMNGEKIIIKKSKEQVYNMLIEKGIKHISD